MSNLDLLEKLNPVGLERARCLPLFADPTRLARKPRCGREKGHNVIRSASTALTHPYVQPNGPVAYSRIVLDLDWHDEKHPHHSYPIRYLSEGDAWEHDLSVPAPDWVAVTPGKNSAHIGYEILTPVGRHEHARIKPQQYLSAIESALTLKLGADAGYAGLLCKNPLHEDWDFYKCNNIGRELSDFASWLDLTPVKRQKFNREPRGEIGRNVYLFDQVRFWAYDNIEKYRNGNFEIWVEAVLVHAQIINTASYDHLPVLIGRGLLSFSECRAIARSVSKWVWANHGTRKITEAFSELQSERGKLGATAAAAVKRGRREAEIVEAISDLTANGVVPSMRKVAEKIGCSQPTLSKHYKHLFLDSSPD